jgi:hypothetical protein
MKPFPVFFRLFPPTISAPTISAEFPAISDCHYFRPRFPPISATRFPPHDFLLSASLPTNSRLIDPHGWFS